LFTGLVELFVEETKFKQYCDIVPVVVTTSVCTLYSLLQYVAE
jgi:threonine aldolase